MKRRKEEEGGGQEWLNTYADMITLVLTFFVLLYSISNVNITKLEQIAAAMQKKLGMEQAVSLDEVPEDIKYPTIGEETGGVPDSTSTESIQKMAEELREYFANSNIDAQTSSSDDVIYIRFKNDLLFGPDSAQLREESVSMLDSLGNMLMEKEDEILAVYINGHTAQAPSMTGCYLPCGLTMWRSIWRITWASIRRSSYAGGTESIIPLRITAQKKGGS